MRETVSHKAFLAAQQAGGIDSSLPSRRITSAVVRELCGGVSDMTLWRWLNDPELHFPKPIYIARRRYWREADVIAWLEAQATMAVA